LISETEQFFEDKENSSKTENRKEKQRAPYMSTLTAKSPRAWVQWRGSK
jgi:hypothetical protein